MSDRRIVALAVLLCMAASTMAAPKDLTSETFDQHTATGTWMIMFYAPWCGFCQRLEPIWNDFAKETEGSHVNVARVNCDEHRMLCRRFDVNGYPTLKLIVDQKLYEYPEEGNRDAASFKEFATTGFASQTAQPVPQGNTILDPLLAGAEAVVMDLLNVYEHDLISMIIIAVGAATLAIILACIILPLLVGFGPSFIVPRTIYILRRPGQRPVIVSEPSKYKIKAD